MAPTDEKTILTDGHGTIFQPPTQRPSCLIQYSGANLGRRYLLDSSSVIIGRSPQANIVITDSTISREHARCVQVGTRMEIEDINSSNGSFVNDSKIKGRVPLRDGDIVRLGSVLFKYFAHDNVENIFHDKIYRMATIDGGTQIFNRKYLMETLESEFKISKTYGRPLTLIYYDLDFFKKVNDQHGHSAGDHILKESAQLVKTCIRKDDIFGRIGGEEFAIILPNTNSRTAYDLAERIRKLIEEHVFKHDSKKIKQTVSFGVSENRGQFSDFKSLLDDADKKLYHSKSTGRNIVTV
jgi:diguanylate cyclase (GGDEF)-like protein